MELISTKIWFLLKLFSNILKVMAHKPDSAVVRYLEDKANEIRILSIECTNASKSGYYFPFYMAAAKYNLDILTKGLNIIIVAVDFNFISGIQHHACLPRRYSLFYFSTR